MSLPPGFLDEIRTRVPISRVIGRRVVWDQRKSNQARGDWWAPCPFHQEKSASFHCDDQKGFYYCFGCQAKGDVVTFLRELDGLEFIDAVKLLATEAGLTMPAPDPRAQVETDRRTRLAEVTEASARWFRLQLNTVAASEARDYLAQRGLDAEALARFEIGFAPDMRQGLTGALRERGIDPALITESGMAIAPDGGAQPYDRFRGRIIFPIRDGRDRVIGFGGRAMDPNARAKYLNSPETPLFDKGRNLYNVGPARAAIAKGATLIVAEGYMDVIALVRAGFEGAVAPLGTAITEEQLRLMWRVSPEPVIMLDGDAAGQRAAMRLIDLALPMTGPGQALRFAVLPGGLDPDDLIRDRGASAMAEVVADARPLVDLLWSREIEGKVFDSPERRAGLDRDLRKAIAQIPDESTKAHYADEIRQKRRDLFGRSNPMARSRNDGTRPRGKWQKAGPLPATAQARASVFVGQDASDTLLEGAVLLLCANYRELVIEFETRLERLSPKDAGRASLLHDLLSDGESKAGREALEILRSDPHIGEHLNAYPEKAVLLANVLDRLEAPRASRTELPRAEVEMTGEADEGLTWRMHQLAQARQKADHPTLSDTTDLGEDRDALASQLQDWLSDQIWRKPGR